MRSYERSDRLFRSRRGKVFGVCQGLSDKMGINVSFLRFALVILTLSTGFFPFAFFYIVAAMVLPVEHSYRR